MRRLAPAVVALVLGGCNCGRTVFAPPPLKLAHDVGSFRVEITKITTPTGAALSGGDGTQGNPFPFPFSNVIFHVKATALDERGQDYPDYSRPVAIRVTPGDLNPGSRWLPTQNGVAEGDITVSHVYGRVSIWAMDQEPTPIYLVDAGSVPTGAPSVDPAPDGGSPYTHAAGTSPIINFKTPTIVDTQRMPLCDPRQSFSAPTATCGADSDTDPACKDSHNTQYACVQHSCVGSCDNRLSPLSGDFVSIDQPAPATDMLITAITQDGFYVTDLKAEKLKYPSLPSYEAAWQALPGKFNSLFVYTYSAPTNLYVGDHLQTLTGSVQEFSGDTQLDFPAWLKVDAEPTPNLVPEPYELKIPDCSISNKGVDRLCGYYNSNVDLESLESSPVIVRNVRPSNLFVNCDLNGDTKLPLFVNSTSNFADKPDNWGCFTDDPLNLPECACEIACIVGEPYPNLDGSTNDLDGGLKADTVCSEATTFTTYGQWEVVMNDPDAGYSQNVRINVTTRDALTNFNPLDLQKPEHQGITFDVAGMLNQVQASRPRWLIYARGPEDVCCHSNPHDDGDGGQTGLCPTGVRDCNVIGGQ